MSDLQLRLFTLARLLSQNSLDNNLKKTYRVMSATKPNGTRNEIQYHGNVLVQGTYKDVCTWAITQPEFIAYNNDGVVEQLNISYVDLHKSGSRSMEDYELYVQDNSGPNILSAIINGKFLYD